MAELRQTPIFEVLTRTDLVAGVEPRLWVFNLGLGWLFFMMIMMMELGLRRTALATTLLALAMWLFHLFLRAICRHDPLTRAAYTLRYQYQADIYDPWPHLRLQRNPRPYGFGRGALC